jgi:hypothetical protein
VRSAIDCGNDQGNLVFKRIALLTSCIAGLPALSHAASIVQDWDTGLNTTDFSASYNFAQFDPTLGTLDSVVITLNASTERDILFQNTSPSSGATLHVAANAWSSVMTLTGPDGTNLTSTNDNANILLTTAVYGGEGSTTPANNGNGTTTIAGTTFDNNHLTIVSGGPSVYPDVATYYSTTSAPTETETLTSGLGLFLGTSTFSTLTSLGYSTTGGNNYTAFQTWADGNVMVTYNYTPVPLPAGLPLLLSGLGALGALARRARTPRA